LRKNDRIDVLEEDVDSDEILLEGVPGRVISIPGDHGGHPLRFEWGFRADEQRDPLCGHQDAQVGYGESVNELTEGLVVRILVSTVL